MYNTTKSSKKHLTTLIWVICALLLFTSKLHAGSSDKKCLPVLIPRGVNVRTVIQKLNQSNHIVAEPIVADDDILANIKAFLQKKDKKPIGPVLGCYITKELLDLFLQYENNYIKAHHHTYRGIVRHLLRRGDKLAKTKLSSPELGYHFIFAEDIIDLYTETEENIKNFITGLESKESGVGYTLLKEGSIAEENFGCDSSSDDESVNDLLKECTTTTEIVTSLGAAARPKDGEAFSVVFVYGMQDDERTIVAQDDYYANVFSPGMVVSRSQLGEMHGKILQFTEKKDDGEILNHQYYIIYVDKASSITKALRKAERYGIDQYFTSYIVAGLHDSTDDKRYKHFLHTVANYFKNKSEITKVLYVLLATKPEKTDTSNLVSVFAKKAKIEEEEVEHETMVDEVEHETIKVVDVSDEKFSIRYCTGNANAARGLLLTSSLAYYWYWYAKQTATLVGLVVLGAIGYYGGTDGSYHHDDDAPKQEVQDKLEDKKEVPARDAAAKKSTHKKSSEDTQQSPAHGWGRLGMLLFALLLLAGVGYFLVRRDR